VARVWRTGQRNCRMCPPPGSHVRPNRRGWGTNRGEKGVGVIAASGHRRLPSPCAFGPPAWVIPSSDHRLASPRAPSSERQSRCARFVGWSRWRRRAASTRSCRAIRHRQGAHLARDPRDERGPRAHFFRHRGGRASGRARQQAVRPKLPHATIYSARSAISRRRYKPT